ncbi:MULTISPECIES: VOC family protein [Micromonosporaceae]|uniref:VOC family protein n=1 Tax=Micromonosporaceae TaxID=28056 RepID=UPI002415D898|nr:MULTISPECIES: VOC family protein [unclassified Solwaraspora]MDG4772468.1 VOC family protein [Solwaraspora sp. WMMD792]WBB95509.1 VOC family protein [Solwaraspora sp. WMMA2059]WBC20586.1 VOC family protein [Solwaraspora sp. WMMA2080]WFE21509.1 VOC family protein [Solwaraspora sp. WMMD937]WJK37281.1 VOC family protein [Solwaraspora sp. WMMA2065]
MATGLTHARWTHVALPTGDLDKAISFYTSLTPLVVVERFADADGESVWLSNDKQVETPFVLVLVSFNKDKGGQLGLLHPFAHIGIEVPNRSDVDEIAERAREMGCLHWEPRQMPPPVGYICALKDPDGNVIEISHDQQVFDTVRRLWGS